MFIFSDKKGSVLIARKTNSLKLFKFFNHETLLYEQYTNHDETSVINFNLPNSSKKLKDTLSTVRVLKSVMNFRDRFISHGINLFMH